MPYRFVSCPSATLYDINPIMARLTHPTNTHTNKCNVSVVIFLSYPFQTDRNGIFEQRIITPHHALSISRARRVPIVQQQCGWPRARSMLHCSGTGMMCVKVDQIA